MSVKHKATVSEAPRSDPPRHDAPPPQGLAPEAAGRCYCLALRQAARRITQLYDRSLAPTGLRGTQLPILSRLADTGPLSIKILSEYLVMDRATLGHNLRPLEAQGLVRIEIGADRRSRTVVLTDAGRERLHTAGAAWQDAQAAFETAYGGPEAAELRTMLGRVAHTEYNT